MKKVIKEAFVEGRTTTTPWEDSEAKRNQGRLDLFAENVDNFNGREFNSPLALERIDPDTGMVVDSFPTRLAAARWVVDNVLNYSGDKDKKAISITGNMHMCMSNGWKAYGSYWKYVNPEKKVKAIQKEAHAHGGKMIWTKKIGQGFGGEELFQSITAAAKGLGVGEKKIKSALKGKSIPGIIVMEGNATPVNKEFESFESACQYFGYADMYVRRMIANKKPINNINIIIKKKQIVTKEVIAYRGRKPVGSFPTITECANSFGLSRDKVSSMIKSKKRINGLHFIKKMNVKFGV